MSSSREKEATVARQFRTSFVRRAINKAIARAIRAGKLADNMYLLTTVGRKSGLESTTPVTLTEMKGQRYLVSPYGNRGWVFNVRASGTAKLSRGGNTEEVRVTEVDAEAAAPVLKQYVHEQSVVSPYFDVGKDGLLDDFAAEAAKHPVFLIT
jgi:deazaflavin-dependent oxidoreductase (nitroreductase family)